MIAAAGAGGALLLAAVAALAIVVINNSSAHVKVAKVAVVTDSYPLKLGSTLTPVVRSQPHPLQRARGARRLADNDPGK